LDRSGCLQPFMGYGRALPFVIRGGAGQCTRMFDHVRRERLR
jgi:hypothetical protein